MLRGWLERKRRKLFDSWYGVIYHEDVAVVKDSFDKMLKKACTRLISF